MPIELKMPALSPTMEEGTLAKWLVKAGDTVKSGDLLAEIETDKATMEFEAVDEGTIAKILVAEGTDGVKVGTVIALIAEEGEDSSAAEMPATSETPVPASKASEPKPDATDPNDTGSEAAPAARTAAQAEDHGKPADAVAAPVDGERVRASPLARRMAAEKGVDLGGVTGSGPNGRIVKADIAGAQAGAVQPGTPPAEPAPGLAEPVASATHASPQTPTKPAPAPENVPFETIKLSNMRKTIARRLTESKQTVPHYYLAIDCNLDKLMALRAELNTGLESRGIKLSVNDFLIKALGVALEQVPDANVQFAGDTLIKFGRADISMAVAIEGGLITPVIKDAAALALSRIATKAKDLAGRAREGKLKPEEYQGGTASISNLGMYGIKQFEAVINPPQGMIMAVGAGEKRATVVDGALAVANVMTATGSFDHRAIDGATGAQLMQAFKALVEAPLGMVA